MAFSSAYDRLGEAARSGDVDTARTLLALDVDLNPADRYGDRCPLTQAAQENHGAIVELLLQNGADPNLPPGEHSVSTPLLAAARHGNLKMLRLLLAHGAEVDSRHDDGQTPLMQAAQHGFHDVIHLLLAHGADLQARTTEGYTALHYADWWCEPRGTAQLLRRLGAKM